MCTVDIHRSRRTRTPSATCRPSATPRLRPYRRRGRCTSHAAEFPTDRKRRIPSRPRGRPLPRTARTIAVLFLALCISSLSKITRAMIYLEDPAGAVRHDSLPNRPGTPEHYLTRPPVSTPVIGSESAGAVGDEPLKLGLEHYESLGPPVRFENAQCRNSDGRRGSYKTGEFDLYENVTLETCGEECASRLSRANGTNDDFCFGYEYYRRERRCEVWKVPISENKLVEWDELDCYVRLPPEEGSSVVDDESLLDSGAPTPVGSVDNLASNASLAGDAEAIITNSTTNLPLPNNDTETNSSSLFDRRRLDESTAQPSASPSTQRMTQRPSESPTFLPHTGSPPDHSDSVTPEVTGKFADHRHDYYPRSQNLESPSDEDAFDFFDDNRLVKDPRDFVYYDSKQARFGVDLGPLGNAAFVNLMLPPRWYREEIGEEGGDEALPDSGGDHSADVVTADQEVGGDDENNNAAALLINATVDLDVGPNSTDEISPNMTSSYLPQDVNGTRGRDLETVDQLWESDSYVPETASNATSDTGHGGIFADTSLAASTSNLTTNGTMDAAADNVLDIPSKNITGSTDVGTSDDTDGGKNITTLNYTAEPEYDEYPQERPPASQPPSTRAPIADYFCFEDFVDWMIERRNASSTSRNVDLASRAQNATTLDASLVPTSLDPANADNYSHDHDKAEELVESTRPITILASRGRCSFESKARLAMLLNDLLANSGRTNRIDHVIIYNNGTDTDNNTVGEERLLDMGRVTEKGRPCPVYSHCGDEIKVGLLYVTTRSGEDLIRRIENRREETNVSPYMDVSMMFPEDEGDENSNEIFGRRLVDSDSTDEDSLIKDHENNATVGQDADEGYHDDRIAHGWFFPATLTRFCLSCGEEQQWGLVWGPINSNPANDDQGSNPSNPNDPLGRIPITSSGPIIDGRYPTTIDYHTKPWLEAIRKLMIAILTIVIIGPMLLAARRWYTVGGTFRITTDENGRRRVRMIGPNLEVFVNGVPDTTEANGTKLDRAQVFSLPEIEYTSEGFDEDEETGGERDCTNNGTEIEEPAGPSASDPLVPQCTPSPPSKDNVASGGRFVSSTTCSICINEFVPGEMLRVLPRCNHAFHTECILPWLTERQGCCPMCKVPVLPDEQQRNRRRRRRSRSSRRRIQGSQSSRIRGGQRRHWPRPTPNNAEEPTESAADDTAPSTESTIVEGVRLVSEIEGDLDPAPRAVVTPHGSPSRVSATTLPLRTTDVSDEQIVAADLRDDLVVLEQGRPVTPSSDGDVACSNSSSDETFATAGYDERF